MSNDQPEKDKKQRVLYGYWISPYMAQIGQLLMEADIDFIYKRVSPFSGTTHKDEISKAKIPCFKDSNGQYVSESLAICRYIFRMYPEARKFYPCDDPIKCIEVDAKNDYITYSITGPFLNWFIFGAYFPKALKMKIEKEAEVFGKCTLFMIKGALNRLIQGSKLEPYLMGPAPYFPDFHLFQLLELSRNMAKIFDIPLMNLVEGDQALQEFYDTMSLRSSTKEILHAQADDFDITKQEMLSEVDTTMRGQFNEIGAAVENVKRKEMLKSIFGHDV